MERMRDELGRAGRRGRRILTPDGVVSPMDLNPTVEVSAAVIADCVAEADRLHLGDVGAPGVDPVMHPVMDAGMRDAAAGRPPRKSARDTA